MSKTELCTLIEAELAEARQKAKDAQAELIRLENTYAAYMGKRPAPDIEMRETKESADIPTRAKRSDTLAERVSKAIQEMAPGNPISAKIIFETLGESPDRYKSVRPTITTRLRKCAKAGTVKKVGHGVYQKPIERAQAGDKVMEEKADLSGNEKNLSGGSTE